MRKYYFALILLSGFLSGCSSESEDADGCDPSVLDGCYIPRDIYGTELVTELISQDFIGELAIDILDINGQVAAMDITCDNTNDCIGVKRFKYSGVYSTLVFDMNTDLGSDHTIESLRTHFQKLDLKLRLIEKEKQDYTISFNATIDALDTILMGGELNFDRYQDGKLHGVVTGLIDELTKFDMSQKCQETPTADCYTYLDASVNYTVGFAITLPND